MWHPKHPAVRRILLYVVLATILGGVFLLYWRPGMAVDLAARLWSCF